MPKKLENKKLWPALAEIMLCVLIILVTYFYSIQGGGIKNSRKEGFENDLKEWKDLKGIAGELES